MRVLFRLGVLAVIGTAVRYASRRRRLVRQVLPELRHRGLLVPVSVVGPRTLGQARRWFALTDDPVDGVDHREVQVGPTPDGHRPTVHVYRPVDAPQLPGALLWIHGGGLIVGSAAGDHARASALARDLGVVVVNVDYRLAPERPFPAAFDDCWAALSWMADQPDVDPARLGVGGASAGGGLAAAVAQAAADRGVDLAAQLLVYPMLDDRTVAGAGAKRDWLAWTASSNRYGWESYLGHRVGRDDEPPYAVPARRAQLDGLAPAWIGVGSLDQFHDECVAYAGRLQAAGVPCELMVVDGMYHAPELATGEEAPSVRRFWDAARQHVARAIGSSS